MKQNYRTYTFMEHDSKDIIHCVFVDKREVAMKSPVMEMEAFRRRIREMEDCRRPTYRPADK